MLLNKVNLIGRVTKVPELRQVNGNRRVVEFNLAVNRLTKDNEGNYESDIIPCEVWGKLADNFVKYTTKGSLIALEAVLRVDHFQTKDGQNATKLRIIVDSWQNLEGRQTTVARQQGNQVMQNNQPVQSNQSIQNNQSRQTQRGYQNRNFQNQNQRGYQQQGYQSNAPVQNQGRYNQNQPATSVPGGNLDNPPQW